MRITVGFKVTPDYEALRESDWIAGESGGVETRYVPRVLNCFDESALELALRLSDARAGQGFETDIGAVTVGGRDADPYLKTLLALGYARAARVEPEAALDFAPGAVAALIAAYVRDAGSGLLLLGCRSGPADSGTVPFLVAEALGWPCLSGVTGLEPRSDGRLQVVCVADDRILRLAVRPPCVLAVGNAVVSRLRAPTLSDRLARREMPADVFTAADLGVDVRAEASRGACVMTGLEAIRRARAGAIVGGDTPRDKARALYDGHLARIIETL
jgi:electron transfer flavoprotein alpha/beta subunit